MSFDLNKIIVIIVVFLFFELFFTSFPVFNQIIYAGNGMYPLGFGPRVIGRGGADIAVADDSISISLNPAGMTGIQGERLDFSISPGVASTHYKNNFNDQKGDPFYFVLPGIGYVNNPADSRWSYGIALFTPGGMGVSYSLRHPLYQSKVDYNVLLMSVRISPAVAYQVTSRLSVGFAPSISYNKLNVKMPFALSSETIRNTCRGYAAPGKTFGDYLYALNVYEYSPLTEIKGIDSFGYGFTFGILYKFNSQLTIGLSYVSRHRFDLTGKVSVDADRQLEVLEDDLQEIIALLPNKGAKGFRATWDARASFTWPQKVGIGFAYKPWNRWLIAFDATWIDWPDFLGDWVLKVKNGDNEDINAIIGSTISQGVIPQNWKDGYIFSLGMEYELSESSVLRAGFAHGNSVAPSSTVTPLGPAISKNHATLGWGRRWESFELNLAYEHVFRNSSSRVARHKGGRDFDNSKNTVSVDTLLMMYTWHF